MATTELPKNPIANWEQVRDEWLQRLNALVDQVETWSRDLGWATRRIEINLRDSQIGKYKAPALLLQSEITRIILQPLGRSAPGVDGVVDLYLMPAYDDIASLLFHDGGWQFHYAPPGSGSIGGRLEIEPKPLSKETLHAVLEEMKRDAENYS